jgi:hypothetical protein
MRGAHYIVIPANSFFVVMPAEAGIQGLHGIARLARDDINCAGFPLSRE